MPIEYQVDLEQRLVRASGHGKLTSEEIFAYQRETWSRPELAGFNELIDMRDVVTFEQPSSARMQDLAKLAAGMDSAPAKFAIVARDDLAFGLGRMYQSYRETDRQSMKTVGVFRAMETALQWLAQREGPTREVEIRNGGA